MARDETFVPSTRSDRGIVEDNGRVDYDEIFGDTPLYTLLLLIRQQIFGFPAYLRTCCLTLCLLSPKLSSVQYLWSKVVPEGHEPF